MNNFIETSGWQTLRRRFPGSFQAKRGQASGEHSVTLSPGLTASGGVAGRSRAEPADLSSLVYPDHLSAMIPYFFREGLRTRPLISVKRRTYSFVLWGASHSAMALGSKRDEKAANEEAGALAQKTAERSDPRGQSGSLPEAETRIRSELRPLHACPVRTRTRHPGAAAGCTGAESGAWSSRGRGQRLIVRSVARRRWPPGPGLEVGAAAATASTAAASSSAAAALQPTCCLGSALLSQNGCRCRGRGSLRRLRASGREEDHRAAGYRSQVRAEAPQLGHQRGQDGTGLPAEAGEARTLRAGQRRPRRLAAALPRSGRTGWRLCVPGARGPRLREESGLSAASRAAAGRAPCFPWDALSVVSAACGGWSCRPWAALGTPACGRCAARASLGLRGDG